MLISNKHKIQHRLMSLVSKVLCHKPKDWTGWHFHFKMALDWKDPRITITRQAVWQTDFMAIHPTVVEEFHSKPHNLYLYLKMLLGDPALFYPLTREPRSTQTGEPAHSVHTGGSVPAGLWDALIHINLTVSTLEARHTEARVAVPAESAYCPVLARVWRALVHRWRRPVRGCTYEQITCQIIHITEHHCSWCLGVQIKSSIFIPSYKKYWLF